MAVEDIGALIRVVTGAEGKIAASWLDQLRDGGALRSGRMREAELRAQVDTVLGQLRAALASGGTDVEGEAFEPLRATLGDVSRSRAVQGFSPTDTMNFVFSLKEPVYDALNAAYAGEQAKLSAAVFAASRLIDRLGLFTMEEYQRSREEVIGRQGQEISELSTPVVKLWDGILALPLIGTLDSARTTTVMETLLQAIVDEEAEVAIIDITGVPTVDTLVAQHLLKTVAAARLMGAECMVSGIRPQIAQTMVHLGVELTVASKATLADAFALALKRTGRAVVRRTSIPLARDDR
ncbi:STAS domain-containing protein [Lichenibacterium dinghuense]|uniref:STAS domain-containing protein n=1 Tax=Lichenibacterium dinghuense TaxID=2895977 RepID=UPI001F448093|nr:STAS domain-containing protein [Lichenibacterium sp. 6Y81]